MNNFINVRLQAYNHKKQLNLLKHNTRKIKSLSEQDNSKNNYLVFADGGLFELGDKSFKDGLYDSLKNSYDKDRAEHNEKVYARRKRNLTNEQCSWLEGVFTFSQAIHHDLGSKYTQEELSQVAADCAKDLATKYGSELRYMVLHMDETTPHFHFSLKNFDENGRSIFHKIKHKEVLQKIQDLAFEHFGKLGMERGVSKEITGKNYKTITNYYIQQQIELKAIISSLNIEVKQIQATKREIKNNAELSKAEKKIELDKLDLELKNVRNTIKEYKDLNEENEAKLKSKKEELKSVNNDIDVANSTLKDLNKQITTKEVEVNNFKNLDNSIDKKVAKTIDDLIEKPLGLLGNEAILDIDTLRDKFKKQLKEAYRINIKANEIEEQNKIIEKQKEDIAFKDKEITQKDTKINNLTQTTQKLEKAFMVNYEQLQAIKRDFKTKVANQVRRLNLFNRLKRSNIASKIRNRLSKELDSNSNLHQRER